MSPTATTSEGPTTAGAALRWLAARCPWEPEPSDRLQRAAAFLGVRTGAATLAAACDALALSLGALGACAALPVVRSAPVAVLVGALVGGGVALAGRRVPCALAGAKRARALGAAPGVVARVVLRLRLTPAPETAAAFAARTATGPLAESLRRHRERAAGTHRSALATFGREWAEWFPALGRAMVLAESATRAPPAERDRTLDRALAATLEGTESTMREFTDRVRGPATALYAFGVMVPLALVAMVPAADVAGLRAPTLLVVAVYDAALPACLAGASAWLLARRPVAFPPPAVPADHPAVPDRRWPAALAALLGGAIAWVLATSALPRWCGLVAVAGVVPGIALAVTYRPVVRVHRRVRAVEAGLADALYLVGHGVERGRSVEAALADAADELDGPVADVLSRALRQQRVLDVDVRTAFLGSEGALATVPSPRARSAVELLVLAAGEGEPAGRAVVAMADHLDDLDAVEREARRELRRLTRTLAHTAAVFAPLVGGATLGLAERMGAGGRLGAGAAPPELGPAVAAYVLLLAAILTALAAGLERGVNRAVLGYRVGLALLSAATVLPSAFAAVRLLV